MQGEEGSVEMASGRRTHLFAKHAADDILLRPADLGLPERERLYLPPLASQHACLNAAILAGEAGPAADQVAMTAGTILFSLGAVADLGSGYVTARSILQAGKAQRRLELLRG